MQLRSCLGCGAQVKVQTLTRQLEASRETEQEFEAAETEMKCQVAGLESRLETLDVPK